MEAFLHEFIHLLTDPAHTAVEFTFVLIDVLIIQAVARKLRKHFHRDQGLADNHSPVVH